MISMKYRQACAVLVTQLRTLILTPPAVVAAPPCPDHDASLPEATLTEKPSSPAESRTVATVTDDALAQFVTHLEYLGYEIGPAEPDGWNFARHPYRYQFSLRMFDQGLRLHCAVGIGASIRNSRAAWVDFLNTANECSHITRFSLFDDEAGVCRVRMRTLVNGAYSRPVFARTMDMWHDDLDVIRRKPEFAQEKAGDDEDVAAATVN
jgi:hypothetical protein